MDPRFLTYYNEELGHLRQMSGEFASEFPKIAGRLGLGAFDCADPYVERLLEGFAFLSARVRLRLDEGFPRLTESILETVFPQALASTPSMAVVQFTPAYTEASLAAGVTVPRDTTLTGAGVEGTETACQYRTAHDVTLWPLELREVRYVTRELAALGVPSARKPAAGLRIVLASRTPQPIRDLPVDRLPIFLRGGGEAASLLLEQIFANTDGVLVQPAGRAQGQVVLPGSSVEMVGHGHQDALFPQVPRRFSGYRLLQEYFAFPQRFMFFELTGLGHGLSACDGPEAEIILLFDQKFEDAARSLDVSNFALFCTPAINLFPRRADRIHVTDSKHEYHVVPDRTRPLDFEVYSVENVIGYGTSTEDAVPFGSFYAVSDSEEGQPRAHFAVHRRPRRVSQAGRGSARSTYRGSEVFLSLAGTEIAKWGDRIEQLSVATLCTNRDLPLLMPVGQGATDFTLSGGLPVQSSRVVSGPTRPRAAPVGGEMAWQAISHLTLNYLSLSDTENGAAADALRETLRLYSWGKDEYAQQQVDGILSVDSRPVTRRVPGAGPISFGRGLQVTVTFDEQAFAGMGCFVLGSVLRDFFAQYVTVNSFAETVIRTQQRGEIMRWPARLGQQHML